MKKSCLHLLFFIATTLAATASSPTNSPDTQKNAIGYIESLISSGLPTPTGTSVQQWEDNLPTGAAIQSFLGVGSDRLASYPTAVLNLPPYANWTEQGWNVRFHGNIYRQPEISANKLDDLTNIFLIGTSVKELPLSQASQARNLTSEIFVVQDAHALPPVFTLEPAPSAGSSGEPGGGGAITASGGNQTITFPYNVTVEGDYDGFVPIASNGLMAGNVTKVIQRLNVHTNGTDTGNATAFLVPPMGLTIVNDIDDILRVTQIYDPKQGLLNTFARPFTPWLNMPEIYANWSRSLLIDGQATHFHYLTTTPEQVTRNYEEFILGTYPGGSFDTRPLNFSDVSATLSIREFLLTKIFQTFPERKFILVADTSNSDVMRDYPSLYHQYPTQVQCIFLRNTTATDSADHLPYDTSGFKGIPQQNFMFFLVPDDLKNLDIAGGNCYNASVQQNVTFGEQGLPFGTNLGSGSSSSSGTPSSTGSSSSSNSGKSNKGAKLGARSCMIAMTLAMFAQSASWLL